MHRNTQDDVLLGRGWPLGNRQMIRPLEGREIWLWILHVRIPPILISIAPRSLAASASASRRARTYSPPPALALSLSLSLSSFSSTHRADRAHHHSLARHRVYELAKRPGQKQTSSHKPHAESQRSGGRRRKSEGSRAQAQERASEFTQRAAAATSYVLRTGCRRRAPRAAYVAA